MEIRNGYKSTEIGLIPTDWDAVELAELFTFKNGLNKAKQFFGRGTPIVNYMDVFNKTAIWNVGIQGRVEVNQKELGAYEVRKGDVFFTRTSETVDEIGTASVMLDSPEKTVYSGFVLRARPTNNTLDDLFKAYCFSPKYFRTQITARASYTTRALTNGRSLSASVLARPPKQEQQAIATALSDVDALIVGLEKLIAKKRDLKQAAMQQLLTGQTRLPGFSGVWESKRLGEIANLYQPETISQTSFTDHGYPVFGANGVVGMYSRFNHSTPQITISCRGNCGTVNRTRGPAWITGNAMVVNLDGAEGLDKSYVYHTLTHSDLSVLVTGSGIPQIVRKPLNNFVINIPADIQEQSAIAGFLSDLDDEIAHVETRLAKTREIKQGMMQELLTGRTRLV